MAFSLLTTPARLLLLLAAGRLIFELGGIPERELAKLKEEADRLGKSSFAFAFYMDTQVRGCSRERDSRHLGSDLEHMPTSFRFSMLVQQSLAAALPLHHKQ
jgi:hypothetical protein